MEKLSHEHDADLDPSIPEDEIQGLSPEEIAVQWWENFAAAVENPRISTYDYLKNSFLKRFELDGAQDAGDFVARAKKKAFKELLALTDIRELRDTIARLEKSRLIFPEYRSRVAVQFVRVILDTYITAKDEYDADMKKRAERGLRPPSEERQKAEIKKIVNKKLAEPEIKEALEDAAEAITGIEKEDIEQTIDDASKQLRKRRSLSKIANDVFGISKKYVTLDNSVNIGVYALPLMTWNYRWAVAAVFGIYVSRMAAIHGYRAAKALLWKRDQEKAKEEGSKTLAALKAAGGNVLAIGISPLVGRLPARIAVWSTFVANTAYNKILSWGEALMRKKKEIAPDGVGSMAASSARNLWNRIKRFFSENADTIMVLFAKALKKEVPGKLSDEFEKTAKRFAFTRTRRILSGIWMVSQAAGRRAQNSLRDAFGLATIAAESDDTADPSETNQAFTDAANDNQDDENPADDSLLAAEYQVEEALEMNSPN